MTSWYFLSNILCDQRCFVGSQNVKALVLPKITSPSSINLGKQLSISLALSKVKSCIIAFMLLHDFLFFVKSIYGELHFYHFIALKTCHCYLILVSADSQIMTVPLCIGRPRPSICIQVHSGSRVLKIVLATTKNRALKGKYTQIWNFHHRLVFPHNEVCKKPNVDTCFPLVVTVPDLTVDLRLHNDMWQTDLVPGTKNASCGAVFHHRNEDKDAFLHSLPDWKVCVGCMASNDASGERRAQPYRFEQKFDDGEAVRTGRRWRRRWSPRRLLGEAWEPISAGAEAEPDESRVEHCRWCKCDCRVPMTKIKEHPCCPEAIPLLRRRGSHRLAVRVDAQCVGACVLGLVFDVALTKYFESQCDPDSRQNRFVSVRRLKDVLTVVFWSIVFLLGSLHVRTRAYFTHSFAHHFLCCQNKKEETHAHTARHYFMMAKTAQTIPSHARAFLLSSAKLTRGEHRHLKTVCEQTS